MDKKIFKSKKVLIMGLGLHGGGVGVAKFFCKQGAEVLVTDLKTDLQLEESLDKLKGLKIKYVLGGHREVDFLWPDLIIKNPDVPSTSPYLEIAQRNHISIETDVDLFLKLSKAFSIGVTGTKGKSTTASLIYHILRQKNRRTFLAGNIGVSPLELLTKVKKGDKVILELSSFELEGLSQSPNIAVITNIMPDHLNRYGTMDEYIRAKTFIFKYQTDKDHLVLNEDDLIVRQFAEKAPSKISYFSKNSFLKNIDLGGFRLAGEHNLYNLAAALKVAEILKIPAKIIEKAIKTFKGVASRQELVGEFNNVKYYNDTTATMPEAVIAAINAFFEKGNLILICGGVNKGLKYDELAKAIKEKVRETVLLPGTASDRIKENLVGYNNLHPVMSMEDAVAKARDLAGPGDIVVLSPGGASFNLFQNEFDRGRKFVEAFKNLK